MAVKALEKKTEIPTEPSPAAHPEIIDTTTESDSVEMYYAGSKFFWRSRRTLDIQIHCHGKAVVEVIPFDHDSFTEFGRVYLRLSTILRAIDPAAIELKVKDLMDADIAAGATASDAAEVIGARREAATKLVVSTYTLSRLVLEQREGEDEKLVFQHGASDGPSDSPILDPSTIIVEPVKIERRRKSTTAEVHEAIEGVTDAHRHVSIARQKAEENSLIIDELLKNIEK